MYFGFGIYIYLLTSIQYLILILYLYYRKAADRITDYYNGLMSVNCKPLTMGGDHFVSYPILRAIAAKHGPVCTYMYVYVLCGIFRSRKNTIKLLDRTY